MTRHVYENYPASRLPSDLTAGLRDVAAARVTVIVESASPQSLPTLTELMGRLPAIHGEDAESVLDHIRDLRRER